MSDEIDALEEIAELANTKPNLGSRSRKRGAGKVFFAALAKSRRDPKVLLKRAQSASLTVKRKREGK